MSKSYSAAKIQTVPGFQNYPPRMFATYNYQSELFKCRSNDLPGGDLQYMRLGNLSKPERSQLVRNVPAFSTNSQGIQTPVQLMSFPSGATIIDPANVVPSCESRGSLYGFNGIRGI